ncbi:MAG: hypothetical protein HDS14_00570 [Bacteroides sp.]|nr:hypothetical protein [Bacteroides sp.]
MELSEIIGMIGTALGALGGGGWLINLRASRRTAKATADKALIDNYEARLAALHQTIDHLNATEREHAARICELNHALDDKTTQIRKLTQQVWDSQQDVNKAQEQINVLNERIIALTEERDYYKTWHCRRPDCQDPRGPEPPRKKNKPLQPKDQQKNNPKDQSQK